MQVGFLTACMAKRPLEEVVAFAGQAGFDALEVIAGHLPADTVVDQAPRTRELFAKHGVAISGIAAYGNWLAGDDAQRQKAAQTLKTYVDGCVALGIDVLCALTGLPVEGKSKEQTIAEDFKALFTPVAQYAQDQGVNIAFENWWATLIQHFGHWDAVLEALPFDNVGFNYDPSHLIWQGIDYLAGVDRYADRIFHTHAKDTEIRWDQVALRGNQGGGWWRYVIPGFGSIQWGPYVARLRRAGFDGVLSIEHEDGTFGPEEGLRKGLATLRQFA
ncbi:MAG: sugar phosphate isomerase/epimerase family protein [Candidatus Brocadiia bacterium]